MALQHRITELKGRGKYFLENTRYKIRQYRLTRGSSRTEQIFGPSSATKVLLAFLLILVVAAVYFGAKTIMQKQAVAAPEPEAVENMIENEVAAPLVEPSVPVEETQEPASEPTPEPSAPEPAEPSSEPLPSPRVSSVDFLIDDRTVADVAPLAVLPEPIDLQNMGVACQVDIRDTENDLAAASQFFQKAQQSYKEAVDAVREPAEKLREAMEELNTAASALEKQARKCNAEIEHPNSPNSSEPTPVQPPAEPVPELVSIESSEEPAGNQENQTNETTS